MRTRGSSKFGRSARRVSVVALAAATVATNSLPSEEVRAQADPLSCPPAFPVEQLRVDQVLHGLTVDQGTTPEPFEAKVLGVIDDGIAPGLPMIIAVTSGDAIDAAGGIWAGISGSPVYLEVDGEPQLVGSVSYGLAAGSPIAGITPAAEIYKLLDGRVAAAAAPQVELTAAIERKIVASGAATAEEVAEGLNRLPIPVGVTGVSSARMRRVSRMIRRTVAGVRVYAAGRAAAVPTANGLVAGGNVAAAVSYGDVTSGGIGTVTAVCGNEALLFGHPFFWNGATQLSAHQASAVVVQPDPIFGSFKVANIGAVVGTVDQDRLTGLHTQLGPVPVTTPIRTSFTAADTGASRTSSTNVVVPEFISTAAAIHVLVNLDRVHDRIGRGVVTLDWSASGTRRGGRTWRFHRREKLADGFDATIVAADKVFVDLESLFSNPFEPITIDRVTVSGTVDPAYSQKQLIRLERRVKGRWETVKRREPLRLVPGREVRLRAVLRAERSPTLTRVPLSLTVPRRVGATGVLTVSAGLPFFFEEEDPTTTRPPRNFDELLANVRRGPTGDTLEAVLQSVRRVPGVGRQRVTRRARETAPMAVFGNLSFEVQFAGG
jgi:hypothetical protein